ncbi:MAG: YciI family protein [Bacteroidota bacterium]
MSKKYMLIFVGGSYDGLSPDATQKQMDKWFAWIEKLSSQGKYDSGEALLPGGKVVSQKSGKIHVDGPFAESKEEIGGYFVLKAANVDEAVELCKDYPDFGIGGKIHVREVMKMDMP